MLKALTVITILRH